MPLRSNAAPPCPGCVRAARKIGQGGLPDRHSSESRLSKGAKVVHPADAATEVNCRFERVSIQGRQAGCGQGRRGRAGHGWLSIVRPDARSHRPAAQGRDLPEQDRMEARLQGLMRAVSGQELLTDVVKRESQSTQVEEPRRLKATDVSRQPRLSVLDLVDQMTGISKAHSNPKGRRHPQRPVTKTSKKA